MAGNPFRKKQQTARVAEPGDETSYASNVSAKKKKVVILSPPESPEIPRRESSGRISPPPPPPEHPIGDSDSDSTATADSDLEQASQNTRRNSGSLQPLSLPGPSASGAPFNPFARTLATSEAAFGLQQVKDGQDGTIRGNEELPQRTGGRPPMDVDAFKNILLTGSAVPSPAASVPSQRAENGNSSTDASSRSQQSMFDPYFDMNQETPRTSLDMMGYSSASDDDEEGSSLMSGSERLDDFAPPAPPKNSLKKPTSTRGPQTVSFADFDQSMQSAPQVSAATADQSKSKTLKPHVLHRSPSDLNKPLPPPPQEPVDQGRSALNIPTPETSDIDPNAPAKKVPPPPPPASRRAGQPSNTQGLARSASNAKPPSTADEPSVPKASGPGSKSSPAPPPPPARKTRPLSQNAAPAADLQADTPSPAPSNGDQKSAPMPPPPPRRNPSKAGTGTSVNRTPSTASRSSARRENLPPSNANAPAPPPPRRGAKRESMDEAPNSLAAALNSHQSSHDGRRGSEISIGSGRSNPSHPVPEAVESPASPSSKDILADMNALQAEIDALRAKAGT